MIKNKRLVSTIILLLITFAIVCIGELYACQQNQKQLKMAHEEIVKFTKTQNAAIFTKVELEPKIEEKITVMVSSQPMDFEIQKSYISLREVIEQMDYSMDMGEPCGLSKEDFVKLMEELKYDYTGFYKKNAEFIWEMEQEYQVNAIFYCGIVAQESGWAKHCAAKNNYTGYTGKNGYVDFESEEEGIEATFKLLKENYIDKGLNTISSIAPVYLGYSGGTWNRKVYSAMKIIVSD